MRRKSTRTSQKATPEKTTKETDPSVKTRRSKRRKRSPSKSSDSEDEALASIKSQPPAETPDTTTKSHTPTDEEEAEEPVWKVTSSDDITQGEVHKLKICLTRPSPDSPEKSKPRRSKSNSQTEDDATSSEDKSTTRRTRSHGSPVVRNDGLSSQEGDEDGEEKKGKGKSKGKHKSKIEKSPHLSEPELQTNNEISENVQVTSQSPSIDKPVDNESDSNKVGGDDIQNVKESVEQEEPASNLDHKQDNPDVQIESRDANKIDSSDDEPLTTIQKNLTDDKQNPDTEPVVEKQTPDDVADDDKIVPSIEEPSQEGKSHASEITATQELEDSEKKKTVDDDDISNKQDCHKAQKQFSPKAVEKDETIRKRDSSNEEQTSSSTEKQTNRRKFSSAPMEESVSKQLTRRQSSPEKQQTASKEKRLSRRKSSSVEPTTPTKESENAEKLLTRQQSSPEKRTSSAEKRPSRRKSSSAERTPPKEANTENQLSKQSSSVGDESEKKHEEISSQDMAGKDLEESASSENRVDEQLEKSENSKEHNTDTSNENLKETELPSTSENQKAKKEPAVRRRLKRSIELPKDDDSSEPSANEPCHIISFKTKPKWERSTSLTSSIVKIDLETIRVVWPAIDFPEEPDLHLDIEKERRRSTGETSSKRLDRKISVELKSDSERPSYDKQSSVGSTTQDSEDNSNIIAFNRKISIVDDTASKLKPPPSPAKNPTSDVLYITNLVRPFTLKQLKGLLERTGKIQEEGFWTDRIKSKCYVRYEAQEEAEATRNALHGVQWPIGNGKKLIIEYGTVDDLNKAKSPPAPPPVPPEPEPKVAVKEILEPIENKPKHEEKPPKPVEKKRNEGTVREWDIGKKDVRKERSRSRDRSRRHKRTSASPEDFITRKHRKTEESIPQKLMDDLFLKTKATPSIYWQPLSPDEIALKQQQRLIRMEEHKRRMEENSRMKAREMGRGAFRRRYD